MYFLYEYRKLPAYDADCVADCDTDGEVNVVAKGATGPKPDVVADGDGVFVGDVLESPAPDDVREAVTPLHVVFTAESTAAANALAVPPAPAAPDVEYATARSPKGLARRAL